MQNETIYLTIQKTHDETGCSISELCVFAGIARKPKLHKNISNRTTTAGDKKNFIFRLST